MECQISLTPEEWQLKPYCYSSKPVAPSGTSTETQTKFTLLQESGAVMCQNVGQI